MKYNEKKIDYFSNIGKRLNIKYGNVFVEYNKSKNINLLRDYYRQKLDELLLDEDEKNKKENSFDIFKKKTPLILPEEDLNFLDENEKKPYNNYKYYQLHMEKIKRLKNSPSSNEKPRELVYEPNIDSVKRKIISGPKWETMTGRSHETRLNQSYNFSDRKLKLKTEKNIVKNNEYKKKIKLTPLRKNHSSINIFSKNINIIPLSNINNSYLTEKNCQKKEKTEKIQKKKIKKENIIMNLFPRLYSSKTFRLQETDITNKYLKNIFLIKTSQNQSKSPNKLKRSDTKIFRNHQIGLNLEQLKILNNFKNKTNKNKTIKLKKFFKLKNKKMIIIDDKKNNITNEKNLKLNDSYDSTHIKKSYNSYINKSLLEKNKKSLNRSFSLFNLKIKKMNEFYKFNLDEIDQYNLSKIDGVTYKKNN